jgi:hypothetical protein
MMIRWGRLFSPPRWGGITHISQKIGSEEPIF